MRSPDYSYLRAEEEGFGYRNSRGYDTHSKNNSTSSPIQHSPKRNTPISARHMFLRTSTSRQSTIRMATIRPDLRKSTYIRTICATRWMCCRTTKRNYKGQSIAMAAEDIRTTTRPGTRLSTDTRRISTLSLNGIASHLLHCPIRVTISKCLLCLHIQTWITTQRRTNTLRKVCHSFWASLMWATYAAMRRRHQWERRIRKRWRKSTRAISIWRNKSVTLKNRKRGR